MGYKEEEGEVKKNLSPKSFVQADRIAVLYRWRFTPENDAPARVKCQDSAAKDRHCSARRV